MTGDGVVIRLKEPGFTDLCRDHSVDLAGEDEAASSKVALMRALMDYLETSRVHLVILNRADPLLKFEVARSGTPVYEGREDAFADFCSLALRQHEDSRALYDAMSRYLAKSIEGCSPVNPLVVKRKVQRVLQYLSEIETMSHLTVDEYLTKVRDRRAVERLIQLIVDAAVDINAHVIVDAGLPAPVDSRSSFLELGSMGILPTKLARDLAPSVGERNIIVHQYEDLDDRIIYASIKQTIDQYGDYVRHFLAYVDRTQA